MESAPGRRKEDHPDARRAEEDNNREPLLQASIDIFHAVSNPSVLLHLGSQGLTVRFSIDVMGSTTTASTHKDMAVATAMAMKYWEIEPGVLQFMATTSIPCPDDLFQVIVLVNYLRTIAHNSSLQSKRQSGTRMAIAKVLAFSPSAYATRMQNFNGWATSGKEVRFSPISNSPATISISASSESQGSDTSSPSSQTDTYRTSMEADLWLSIGIMYRASVLLYTLRTLVVDSEVDAAQLLPENRKIDVKALRRQAVDSLSSSLSPVFSDPTSMHQIGKLVLWPLFVLGMETEHTNTAMKDFVTSGFAVLSQAMGTLGPLGAIDELRTKWKVDAERAPGWRVTWDDYFQGREDYIVF
jgi:hypothetical protein